MIRIIVKPKNGHVINSESNITSITNLNNLFDDYVLKNILLDEIKIVDEYIYYVDSDCNAICILGFDNEKLDDIQKSKLGILCKRFLDEKLSRVIDEIKNQADDGAEVCRSFMISSFEAILEKTGFPQIGGSDGGESSISYAKNRLISGCLSIIFLLIVFSIGCLILGK